MADTTVYTIYAGMIPTLGFRRSDFTIGRAGKGPRGIRGGTLNLGTSISPRGRQRKARVPGSMAWYEYSTTVKPIHEEILGGDEQGSDAHNVLRWPTDWKAMFESGNAGLAQEFISEINEDIMKPTGKEVTGKAGTASEQALNLGETTKITHPDDKELRSQGRLVNRANAVDLYIEGRDGNIYRVDVTSMTMDDRAHHGLGSLEGREAAGVDSAAIMEDILGGNIADAEKRLLTYFQGRKDEYNTVIKGLKQSIHDASGGTNRWLQQLDLNSKKQLEDIRRDLENNMSKYSQGDSGQHIMQQMRPSLRTAIKKLERQGITAATGSGTKEGFESAVAFALHALGNIVNSKNTITEYRITGQGAPVPYTIGVRNRIHPSGEQVLEFMALKQADVRIRNEAALENYYLRQQLQNVTVTTQNAIIDSHSRERNEMESAYAINKGKNAIEIGALTTTALGNVSRDAHNLRLGAQAVISDEKFNTDIDNWIRGVGMGRGWKQRVHQFLSSHIERGPMVTHPDDGPNQRGRFTQIAAPVSTDMSSLNHFNMIAHGQNVLYDDFGLDISGARRGSMMGGGRFSPVPHTGQFRSRSSVAQNLMSAAFYGAGGTSSEWAAASRMMSSKGTDVQGFYGMDEQRGIRAAGLSMFKGIVAAGRAGKKTKSGKGKGVTTRPGTMAANSRKYWGLGEYLSDDQQSGFDDNVNPYFWAAPYISIRYPSGQVGSSVQP
jgi:hypothetical protein